MRKSLHILISGRVQGVFFRYSARQRAEELGLTGHARNLTDGRVEIIAEGEESGLNSLLAWAHQGPLGAYVTGVEITWEPLKNSFPSFTIR
jgi:acylphosphatase